jgi:hypothetical protein
MIGRTMAFRNVLIAAILVVILGFLSVHQYNPRAGPVWNVLNAEIWLTQGCPPRGDPLGLRGPAWVAPPTDARSCATVLPFRWVLMGMVTAVAASAMIPSDEMMTRHARLGTAARAGQTGDAAIRSSARIAADNSDWRFSITNAGRHASDR